LFCTTFIFSLSPPVCVLMVLMNAVGSDRHGCLLLFYISNPISLQQHDVQLDYYGKRLATCSSDRMIKIFDVSPDQTHHQLSATIQAHEGPVWQVAWAHPKFGSILASCSYDRKVCVWKETQPQQWSKVYEYADHQSSVNSIAFAPHELGLKIAAASADGTLSILTWRGPQDNVWEEKPIHNAHQIGCNAVSWAPAAAPGSATGSNMIQVVSSWWWSCMMC
jgi:protein transport protein SEC13